MLKSLLTRYAYSSVIKPVLARAVRVVPTRTRIHTLTRSNRAIVAKRCMSTQSAEEKTHQPTLFSLVMRRSDYYVVGRFKTFSLERTNQCISEEKTDIPTCRLPTISFVPISIINVDDDLEIIRMLNSIEPLERAKRIFEEKTGQPAVISHNFVTDSEDAFETGCFKQKIFLIERVQHIFEEKTGKTTRRPIVISFARRIGKDYIKIGSSEEKIVSIEQVRRRISEENTSEPLEVEICSEKFGYMLDRQCWLNTDCVICSGKNEYPVGHCSWLNTDCVICSGKNEYPVVPSYLFGQK